MAILSGCATIAPSSTSQPIPWKNRAARLMQINRWQLSGKIAVQTAKDAGSATVNWIQNQNTFNLSLLGPLGASSLKMIGGPGQVTLQTSEGKIYTANSPEQLLAQQWGFDVPVSYINYWIRGLPVPGIAAQTQFDTYGRLTNLVQQNWRVQFLSYTRANGIELPSRISIVSSALKVKIIVYQWHVG
ncbi:MAG: outer membrane lipoprotein LolB [Gammaproteobacteria bacterium]|nr:outer membrane lipoprotein LolB [Gammaproteobacteria bacterium]